MADLIRHLPGARPLALAEITERLRGTTLIRIEPATARDPDHGGEVLRVSLARGDFLLFFAVPTAPLVGRVDPRPTAFLEVGLIGARGARLRGTIEEVNQVVRRATVKALVPEGQVVGRQGVGQAVRIELTDTDALRIVALPNVELAVGPAIMQTMLVTHPQTRLKT